MTAVVTTATTVAATVTIAVSAAKEVKAAANAQQSPLKLKRYEQRSGRQGE